jgi:hypothetical protein
MPTHQLPAGKSVIAALVGLGEVLDYRVEEEFLVQDEGAKVDVAFLGEPGQRFPLMIFEVESRASGGMASNAIKVLGQTTDNFLKPLFFFHVVLSGRGSGSRIEPLQSLLGTHNYRLYLLQNGDITRLATEILDQHRRIRWNINLTSVLQQFLRQEWLGIDMNALCDAIERLDFDDDYVVAYAALAVHNPWFLSRLVDTIGSACCSEAPSLLRGAYPGYIGQTVGPLLHSALLIWLRPELSDASLNALRSWQEDSSYMSQIGPHFGLNRDYDLFVLGVAPFIWAVASCLARDHQPTVDYIISQALKIMDACDLRHAWSGGIPTAVWLLHVSASLGITNVYDKASAFIKSYGGLDEPSLYDPPLIVDFDEDQGLAQETPIVMPDIDDMRKTMKERLLNDGKRARPEQISLWLLTDPDLASEETRTTASRSVLTALYEG